MAKALKILAVPLLGHKPVKESDNVGGGWGEGVLRGLTLILYFAS